MPGGPPSGERDAPTTSGGHFGVREVHLDGTAGSHDVEYLVELPDSSGYYEFGPAEVRTPEATTWATVPDTAEDVLVVGSET